MVALRAESYADPPLYVILSANSRPAGPNTLPSRAESVKNRHISGLAGDHR
jgi:hypothetical protein